MALGVPHERNVRVGRFAVDLRFGSTVIECYRDFWHCNPATYAPDYYNPSLHMTAEAKWAKDLTRQRAIEALGYRVLIMWERDIKSDLARVERVLGEEIRRAPFRRVRH